jgi:EAL domain-containing protein (putative c-di-GMP-specific phosphodiesterase class I)
MAHALGLVVVAEGVENEAQLIELRRLGCEYAQGFHLARPGPVAQIEALLQRAMSSAI